MGNQWSKVVATWSGGIDSTGVIAHLLKRGYDVHAFTLEFYQEEFCQRERAAREAILPYLENLAKNYGGSLSLETRRADWIWNFSHDGKEIPRRNKHILDHLIITEAQPRDITNLAMGEYVGADSWVVRNHVSTSDADHRALSAYLYLEYGLNYRLISLQDFGESRFKHQRLSLLMEAFGWSAGLGVASLTTNCLRNSLTHCGACYKCIERHCAFYTLGVSDWTTYDLDPRKQYRWETYLKQMGGKDVHAD